MSYQANPAAFPDAGADRRGALARGAQVFPDGPKTMQDLLLLAGNWSHVVDAGFGPFTLTGEPIELGDLSTGTFADLTDRPGLRRYTVAGGGTEMVLGTLDLGFAIDETNGKLELNGQVTSVSADTLTATSAAFGGLVTVDSSGVTIGAGASLSAPAGTIDDLLVTTLTINGAPYVRRLVDSVDTSTGLALSGGVLSLAAAGAGQSGAVTTNSQTIDGAKTFTNQLTASGSLRAGGAFKAAAGINLSTDFVSANFGNVDLDTAGTLGLRLYAINGSSSGDRSVFIGTSANGINSGAKLLQVGWNLGASEALAVYPQLLTLTAGKMASALGALSTDVALTLGTTVADASVNASAKFLSVRTGVGTTETEYAYGSKSYWQFTANNAGAGFGLKNTNGTGYTGVEYYNASGALAVFTGYANATGEFRFNNVAAGGYIDFKLASTSKLKVESALATFSTPISLGGVTARSWPISSTVTTAETQTASTGYASLATAGPSVTMTTGTSVLVLLNASCSRTAAGNSGYMSVAVSGATTIVASDANAAIVQSAGSGNNVLCRMLLLTVTAGSNTFTAQYKNDGGSTWTFSNRSLTVIPLN